MAYILRIRPGFSFTRTFRFVDQARCGVVGDSDYLPRLLFDLTGSTVDLRLWWPGGEFRKSGLTLSNDIDDLGITKLAKATLALTAAETQGLPSGYDFPAEFIRNIGSDIEPLGPSFFVRVDTTDV